MITIAVLLIAAASPVGAETLSEGESSAPPVATCFDKDKIYKICANQGSLYEQTLEQAVNLKKPILAVFGTEWCPRCRDLHRMGPQVSDQVILGSFALYDKTKKIDSGQRLLRSVINNSDAPPDVKSGKELGMPFIFVIDPTTSKARYIPIKKVYQWKGGHSSVDISALKKALNTP